MLTTVSSMGVWGVITALICAQMLRLILFYLVSQYFFHLEYPSLAIALLGVQAIGWLAFAPLFDLVTHQLAYAMIAGSMISISAVALRLIPLPLSGSLSQLKARLVEW